MTDWAIPMLALSGAFCVLFAVAEILYHIRGSNAETTRKVVHIGTGFLALLFPVVLNSHWQVLLLCGSFAVLLWISMRYKLLPSINGIRRKSYGSLGYPVSVYISFLAYEYFGKQYAYYYLPILVLAICDPVAAYVGRRTRYKPYRVGQGIKTVGGSLAFFAAAILVTAGVYLYLRDFPGIAAFGAVALAAGGLATLAEAFSRKGLDNITIPLAVLLGMVAVEQLMIPLWS
ncbi:phosphatidate cytidylyltransferase [Parapedobacter defluvii]|uniref:diacylglycerol/polyprenol kinase family protein n=1 Tax=Parapedobacter defluvii TaxID=2045106 RepID=UPI003341E95A